MEPGEGALVDVQAWPEAGLPPEAQGAGEVLVYATQGGGCGGGTCEPSGTSGACLASPARHAAPCEAARSACKGIVVQGTPCFAMLSTVDRRFRTGQGETGT